MFSLNLRRRAGARPAARKCVIQERDVVAVTREAEENAEKFPKFEEAARASLRYDPIGEGQLTRDASWSISPVGTRLVWFSWPPPLRLPPRCRPLLRKRSRWRSRAMIPSPISPMASPVPGRPDLEYDWDEYRYRFSSPEHRDLFKANPVRYAPQFANFCAMALSNGESRGRQPDILADQRRQALSVRKTGRAETVSAGHRREHRSRPNRTARSSETISVRFPAADRPSVVEPGLAQAIAQAFEIGRVQELASEALRIEGRVQAPIVDTARPASLLG